MAALEQNWQALQADTQRVKLAYASGTTQAFQGPAPLRRCFATIILADSWSGTFARAMSLTVTFDLDE